MPAIIFTCRLHVNMGAFDVVVVVVVVFCCFFLGGGCFGWLGWWLLLLLLLLLLCLVFCLFVFVLYPGFGLFIHHHYHQCLTPVQQ